MKGKKHHSPEQAIKLLAEADTRLNAGQNIAQFFTCPHPPYRKKGWLRGGWKRTKAKKPLRN